MTSRSCAYLLYLFSHCRLIIITTIYTCPNPTPSPSLSILSYYNIEAIAGLVPIKSHLQKLVRRSQLHSAILSVNHLIKTFMDDPSNLHANSSPYSINSLTNCRKTIVKGYLIDSINKLYGDFPFFSSLHLEFNLGSKIVDIFPDQFSFNLASREKNDKKCYQQLDEMTLQSSSSPHMAIVVTDASIKKDIATSISHVHIYDYPLTKTVHHTVYVMSTEVELFAIRYGIN